MIIELCNVCVYTRNGFMDMVGYKISIRRKQWWLRDIALDPGWRGGNHGGGGGGNLPRASIPPCGERKPRDETMVGIRGSRYTLSSSRSGRERQRLDGSFL